MSNDIYPNPETPSKDPLDKKPSPDNKEVIEKIRKRFENGEIDAKEYNRLTMAFTHVKFAEEHGVSKKNPHISFSNSGRRRHIVADGTVDIGTVKYLNSYGVVALAPPQITAQPPTTTLSPALQKTETKS